MNETKRFAIILIAIFLLNGCDYFHRGNKPIYPDEQYSIPASTKPSSVSKTKQGDTSRETSTDSSARKKISETPARVRITDDKSEGSSSIPATAMWVNGQIITINEILKAIQPALIEAATNSSEEVFRIRAEELINQQILRQINRILLLSQAQKRLSDAEKRWVDKQVDEQIARAILEAGSKVRLEQKLREEGMTLEEWRKSLRDTMFIQMHLRDKLTNKIFVSREMMWKYYTTHINEFRSPDKVQMQIISVPINEFLPGGITSPSEQQLKQGREKARELINQAAEALAQGGDFTEVAKKFSRGPMAKTGGVWPMIERGSFRAQAVEETAFAQGVGKVSKIIETPSGFYIVKTLAVQKGQKRSFEEVQQKIKAKLRQQQFEKLTKRYQQKLYADAIIVGLERFKQYAVKLALRKYYHGEGN